MSAERGNERVIILDRDGTLVIDRGYLADPAGLEFEPLAADGLRRLYSRGYRIVVITNQSGVGRGLFPLGSVIEMNARLHVMTEEIGVKLEGIYFCPHAPEEGCECRKPAPGLMTLAAAELGFDPRSAVVIGDKESDIQFGRNCGAATVLIAANGLGEGVATAADYVAPDLLAAARLLTPGV